jgi:hypothetical protein
MVDVRHKSEICPFGNVSSVLRDLPLDPLTPSVKTFRLLFILSKVQKLMPWKLMKAKWCNDFFLPQTFSFCENFTFKLGNFCFPTKKIETSMKSIN